MGMMSLIPKVPRLGRWGMLVANFSSRDLTYDTDISRALAGATEVMGATFPNGIIYGLPAFFFDIALLWQPKFHSTRRKREPSWSWLGWKGAVVTLRHWSFFIAGLFRKVGKPEDWLAMGQLKPVANYQILAADTNLSSPATTMFNGFYEYQALRGNVNAPPPAGWVRHHHPDGDYFTTNLTHQEVFRYGFPLPTGDHLPAPRSISPVLLCTAPRARVSLRIPGSLSDSEKSTATLMHKNKVIGLLVLPDDGVTAMETTITCELVAISEAEVLNENAVSIYEARFGTAGDDDESSETKGKRVKDMMKVNKGYNFFNVLWIEWEGDIAYRKALGTVGKIEWDALNAETITFKFG